MKYLVLSFFVMSAVVTFAQELPNYDDVKLSAKNDFKASEGIALKAASFLLSTPFDAKSSDRLKSLQFIIKWMSGTPDYGFTLDGVAAKISKNNTDMFGLYMAAMLKYVLENPASSKDNSLVTLNTVKMLLAYCENPANKMEMTKHLKKLSEANKKGELEKSL